MGPVDTVDVLNNANEDAGCVELDIMRIMLNLIAGG